MNLLRAASTVSLLTLVSRITGLGRELIVASSFGASAATDAFNVAFRIPNLLRRLFAEGAFTQAFVPILAATRASEGDEVTRRLIDAVATVLAWVLVGLCVVGTLAAPVLVWLMAAGLQSFDSAVVMTRIMFPYIGLMSLVALSAGVLNTWKRYAVPAVTPVMLNLAVMGAALWLSPWFERHGIASIHALAVGVMLGGLMQLAIQWPALRKIGSVPRIGHSISALRAAWAHPGVSRILRQMAPAVLGVSVAQLSLLINTQIASHVGVGAVSWLTYADRLMEFPTALLGVALGVVLLPQLSAAQARQDSTGYSNLLDWGLRLVVLLALPCALALLIFPEALVAGLYHYGRFSAGDLQQTTSALMGYGVGLLGLIGVKVLAPGFYAQQDIRTPVRIALVVLALTQLMNLGLVPLLGHAGLALSIGIGALLNAGLLLYGLCRGGTYVPAPGWRAFLARALAANVACAMALTWAAQGIDWVGLGATDRLLRVLLLAGCLAGVAAGYFLCLRMLGIRLRDFMGR